MKLTGNPRGVQLLIVALLVVTLWVSCRSAEAAEPMFFASGGLATHGGKIYSQGLRIGLESGPWQASVVTMGDGSYDKPEGRYLIEPNIGACGTWHRALNKWSLGWGACVWEHGDWSVGDRHIVTWTGSTASLDDDGVQLTAAILVRRTFGKRDRLYAEAFHASSGGSTHYNAGRNLLSVGARF